MYEAEHYIRVAVMDYIPTTLYLPPGNNTFWPPIDNAIRAAAFRGVQVELLISQWPHSKKEAIAYMLSLLQINSALPKPIRNIHQQQGSISIVRLCISISFRKFFLISEILPCSGQPRTEKIAFCTS
jgi:hypothetical protein